MEKAVFIDLNIALTVPPQVMFFIFLIHLAVETKIKVALFLFAAEVVFSDLLSVTGTTSIEVLTIVSSNCHVFQVMVRVDLTLSRRLSKTVS